MTDLNDLKEKSIQPPITKPEQPPSLTSKAEKLATFLSQTESPLFTPEQKVHLDNVSQRTATILAAEKKSRPSLTQRDQIKLFAFGHDISKFMPSAVAQRAAADWGKTESILNHLELSDDEQELFRRGINAQKQLPENSYCPEFDLSHHLASAYYLVAEAYLDPNQPTEKEVLDAILFHQYSGYYTDVARRLGFSENLLHAIWRGNNSAIKAATSLLTQATNDADKLDMLFPDGWKKIFLINTGFLIDGSEPVDPDTIQNQCLNRTNLNFARVYPELTTATGQKLYERTAQLNSALASQFLEHPDQPFNLIANLINQARNHPATKTETQRLISNQLTQLIDSIHLSSSDEPGQIHQ